RDPDEQISDEDVGGQDPDRTLDPAPVASIGGEIHSGSLRSAVPRGRVRKVYPRRVALDPLRVERAGFEGYREHHGGPGLDPRLLPDLPEEVLKVLGGP